MEINFKLLFKLAQDKGYSLYFTAIDHGEVLMSYKKEEFGILEMESIKKWLWDNHKVFVSVSMDWFEKFFTEVMKKESSKNSAFAYQSKDKYQSPEEALEHGLLTALRTLPDFTGIKTGQHSVLSPDLTNNYSQ